jgi:hypothetical protein
MRFEVESFMHEECNDEIKFNWSNQIIKSFDLLIFFEKINSSNLFSIRYFINSFYHLNLSLSLHSFIFQHIHIENKCCDEIISFINVTVFISLKEILLFKASILYYWFKNQRWEELVIDLKMQRIDENKSSKSSLLEYRLNSNVLRWRLQLSTMKKYQRR